VALKPTQNLSCWRHSPLPPWWDGGMIAAWVAGDLHRLYLISSRRHHLEKTLLRCRPIHLHRLPITPPQRHVTFCQAICQRRSSTSTTKSLSTVIAEQQRRGKKPSTPKKTLSKRMEAPAVTLTIGKLNAVRAAFKAGVRPSKIAKQFGISQSEVRKIIAGDGMKR
jgi:predicted DNA-binding protein (UPF0251 family)